MPNPRKPPSLLVRLSFSALLVVLLAMALIGLSVDRAYRAAEQTALRERLESAVFAVLAGLEVDSSGQLAWEGAPADSRLTQPQSGLYAGVFSAEASWFSPSSIGIEIPVSRRGVPRGGERFETPAAELPWYVYRIGLGWETADGGIVDLSVW